MCPTSNLRTQAVATLAEHPARRLLEQGVRVTINTDDPALFAIDLTHELEVCRHDLGFTVDELTRVTGDHSLVWEMVEAGRLTPEQAEGHPYRNIVTRAIGMESALEVDTHRLTLDEGDRLLLCSDGLTSMVDDPAVADLLGRHTEPEAAVQALVEAAREAGGADNITVALVDAATE